MVDILASIQKYIPMVTMTQTMILPEETSEIIRDDFFQIPLRGYACTYMLFSTMHMSLVHLNVRYRILQSASICRWRSDGVCTSKGSHRIRSNSERGVHRLQGVVPVTEDWHAKHCFLEVGV